jgi:hypothetical protein
MRKWNMAALAAGMICAALLGCEDKVAGGTGVGNPTGTTEFAVVATTDAPAAKVAAGTVRNPDSSITVADAGGMKFTIVKAYVNIDAVRIRLPDGADCSHATEVTCESDDIRLPGPFVSNLMTGASTPNLGTFLLPAGAYRRVEMRLEPLEAGFATPDEALRGHTVFLSGTFDYDGRPDRAFTIALDINEEMRIESGSGMTVLDSGITRMLVQFKADAWLAHSDIGACLGDQSLALDSAGNLAIDRDHSCGTLNTSLSDDVRGSCGLGDEHHDGSSLERTGGSGPR